jgi:hypothetical protein
MGKRPLKKSDVPPELVEQRLRDLAQLYRLGMELRKARRLGKVKDLRKAGPDTNRRA